MGNVSQYLERLPGSDQDRGRKFEADSADWLTRDSIWGSQVNKVWHWSEWPDRWNRDAGIDLVAELVDGTLWAIQNKCYSGHRTITKADIDTFLSESSRKIFTGRIIMSTTSHLSSTLKKTLQGQEKPVKLVLGSDLDESNIDWTDYLAEKPKPANVTHRSLRSYQAVAVEATYRGFESANRGQLIMACGTGKTFTSLRIAERLDSNLTIVCVPSLTLLSQSLRGWLNDREKGFSWLAVCSDESVTKDDSEIKSRLIDFSFPSTTDSEAIENFLASPGRKVIFTTYQSSMKVAQALQKSGAVVDLLIADEAHRIAGNTDKSFLELISDQPAIKISKRLFQTATPRLFTPATKQSAAMAGAELISMDDERIFGQVLYRYDFGQAIADGWLTNYRVAILLVSDKSVTRDLSKNQLYRTSGKLYSSKMLGTHVALDQAIATYGLRCLISFHSSIERAREFAKDQRDLFEIGGLESAKKLKLITDTVTGTQPTSERVQSLARFSQLNDDEALLVTNARCLTEGIDVPALDGVVFADPRSSRIDIVQAVGRAIRLGDATKSFGTIVLPVFVEDPDSADQEIAKSEYKRIWEVITALESHDSHLASEMASIRQSLGAGRNVVELPTNISILHGSELPEGFVEALKVGIVRHSASSWDENYGKLQQWVETHGTSRVPQSQGRNSDRISLGGWVQKQRSDYSDGKLPPARIVKLEEFEDWVWDPLEADWELNIAALEKAAIRFGNFLQIPGGYVDEDGNRVYQWATSLLSAKRFEAIPSDKLARLQAIPFFSQNRREAAWNWGMLAAKKWLEHSDAIPPADVLIPETGNSLRNWFKVASRLVKSTGLTQIDSQRVDLIKGLPNWDKFASRGLSPLRTYALFSCGGLCKRHGAVGSFAKECAITIIEYSDESLSGLKPASLKSLANYLEGVEAYSREFGNCNHPVTKNRAPYKYGKYSLGPVKNGFRSRREKLDSGLKAILEKIPGWVWGDDESRWYETFELLKRFEKTHGTASLSQGVKFEGYELGNWVARQRRRYTASSHYAGLTEYEIKLLEGLKGWRWDSSEGKSTVARDEAWQKAFSALETYVYRENSLKIPQDHQENGIYLARWVAKQKQVHKGKAKAGLLKPEEAKKLEAISGWNWYSVNNTANLDGNAPGSQ
jgi:superfamily II DNA or RNA helicase